MFLKDRTWPARYVKKNLTRQIKNNCHPSPQVGSIMFDRPCLPIPPPHTMTNEHSPNGDRPVVRWRFPGHAGLWKGRGPPYGSVHFDIYSLTIPLLILIQIRSLPSRTHFPPSHCPAGTDVFTTRFRCKIYDMHHHGVLQWGFDDISSMLDQWHLFTNIFPTNHPVTKPQKLSVIFQ